MSPRIPNPELKLPRLDLKRLREPVALPSLRSRRPQHGRPARPSAAVTGLHLEGSEVVVAQARPEPRLTVTQAGALELEPGLVREGVVADAEALGDALKQLFAEHQGLSKRVRVGVANQRTVMRTIDLPPLEDSADIAAAVHMHAPEHIAMPLDQAVLDHHVLGRVETPNGARTRVVVAATDRESVDRLLAALRHAGLRPVGIDLAAFALVRALYRADADTDGPVLYAHVSGSTTLAIAERAVCRFTRVGPAGLDMFTESLAEREGVPLGEARDRLLACALDSASGDTLASDVLDHGVAQLGDDLRTSLEFFATQWGTPVTDLVLSGPALAVPGLTVALERRVGVPVRTATVDVAVDDVEPWRLAVAAGLSVEEVPA